MLPHRLWVADITFVRTWQGFCYTAFVTDACTRKIVGWAVSATMRTEDLPLQAFNHAVWQSESDLSELVSSFRPRIAVPIAGLYRPAGRTRIAPSVGSRGDSYDNALAEAVNAAYKTELINRAKPWRCIDDVELATAQWVARYNQERLHEALGYPRSAEYEAALTGTSHPREPADPGPRNRLGTKPGVVQPRAAAGERLAERNQALRCLKRHLAGTSTDASRRQQHQPTQPKPRHISRRLT